MSKSPSPQQPLATDFNPGYRFLHLAKSDPFQCLAHVFDSFTLPELSDIWRSWVHCAICAEYSDFSEGDGRKHLLQFAETIDALIEALHYALVKWMKRKQHVKLFLIDTKNIRYRHLDGKSNAGKCIHDFAQRYNNRQVKGYLWAMLECVLTDGEEHGVERKNLFYDYEGLLSIGRVAFHLEKKYPGLFRIASGNKSA